MATLPVINWPFEREERDYLDNLISIDALAPIMRGVTPNGRGFIVMRFPNATKLLTLHARYSYNHPEETHWTINYSDYPEDRGEDEDTLDIEGRKDCLPANGFGSRLIASLISVII
ncbi:MAG: hypothetical protein JWM09_455 [Francisellaceae bacterium]|nr:hypothetical protein [Francisellaceae bacterium]